MSNSMKLFDNCSALFGAFYLHFQYSEKKFVFIETDRLCKVVKLSMQCCGQIKFFWIHLRHIKLTF